MRLHHRPFRRHQADFFDAYPIDALPNNERPAYPTTDGRVIEPIEAWLASLDNLHNLSSVRVHENSMISHDRVFVPDVGNVNRVKLNGVGKRGADVEMSFDVYVFRSPAVGWSRRRRCRCRSRRRRGRGFDLWRFHLDVDVFPAAAMDVDDASEDQQDNDRDQSENNGDCSSAAPSRVNNSWAVSHDFPP